MQVFFVAALALTLSGCAALNVLEYMSPENADKIFDNEYTLPSPQNGWVGFVQVGDNIADTRIVEWMESRCNAHNKTVGRRWKGTAGPHSTPHYYSCLSKPSITPAPKSSESFENSSRTTQSETTSSNVSRDIDTEDQMNLAKKKCEELGLKPKTEKFAECVLRLSK
jgi:hypothetical protein